MNDTWMESTTTSEWIEIISRPRKRAVGYLLGGWISQITTT